MISRSSLVSALRDRRASDWMVIERVSESAVVDARRQRVDERTELTVLVYTDTPRGRGGARLQITSDGDARSLVDAALVSAAATVGPSWRATPPAAPAKVDVFDPAIRQVSLAKAALDAYGQLPAAAAGITVDAQLEVTRERVTVQAANGLRTGWDASFMRGTAFVANGDTSLDIVREARRFSDLGLATAITDAAADLSQIADAAAPRPGPCAVILGPETLLHGGGLGVWSVFATQADAQRERRGLARYRLQAPIAPGAHEIDEPIAVRSDGALAFATRSAPLGDDGDAVRTFALVEGGIAVGLGLSMREAAQRKQEPNGGVRNLVVSSGTWAENPPPGRSIEIRRLRSLAIDPDTGEGALEIALALDRDDGREQWIRSGQIRLDLLHALALAKRSASPLRRGAYLGPRAMLLSDVEIHA